MKLFPVGRLLLLLPFLAAFVHAAQEPQRTTAPATANVQSRTYEKDGQRVTERVVTTTVHEVETLPKPAVKAAIFVSNRSTCQEDNALGMLEDMIVSGVTEQGLSVIARDTALHAVRQLSPGAGENALDETLAQNTSAVRLAQNLGADVLLQVTLTDYASRENRVNAYGVNTTNNEKTLRVTYKILDGVTGASLAAETVSARRNVQTTANASEQNDGVLGDLIEEAARKVATSVKRRLDQGRLASASAVQGLVTIMINTEAADLMIPDVRIGAENTVTISESKFKVSPLSVTVEVDGIAVGSAPGTVQVRPGLSKLRLTREGFKPYERTINATTGLTLTAALEMSDAGYARWQESTAFINTLKNGAKLTDAEVKVLEGQAAMLQQSGFKVNVNTKEGITFKNQSLFNQ